MAVVANFGAPEIVDSIDLLVDGKNYIVKSPPGDRALKWVRVGVLGMDYAAGRDITESQRSMTVLNDEYEHEMVEDLLGDTLTEMQDDQVSWAMIQHAGITVLLWITADLETAKRYWLYKETPKAKGKERAPKKTTPKARQA